MRKIRKLGQHQHNRWSVIKTNRAQAFPKLKTLLFNKQTYYILFIWALTWYSFWIFVRQQITPINISGEIIAATGILTASSPAKNAAIKLLRLATPQINRNIHKIHLPHPTLAMHNIKKTITPTMPFTLKPQTLQFKQIQTPTRQITAPVAKTITLEPTPKPQPTLSIPKQTAANTNGCPKNLAYYTQKPRPKQTPIECISCKNLITCVCQTSN